ncbi:MAG: 50S ribosomal protein L22 [Deltaproteobacteria bacterium]|nr:50S ribosomal protein L22 [Deltaproteobacteria bacterium]
MKHKRSVLKYLRISPMKVRAVVDTIRGRKVEDALAILDFTNRAAAAPLAKMLRTAVANAALSENLDVDALIVKEIMVDQGPTLKRYRPRAMGRATQVQKKTSHVTCLLDEKE